MNSKYKLQPLTIECPVCKSSLKNRTGLQAITIVCGNCRGILNTRKNVYVGKVNKEFRSIIPIGTKGKFNNTLYEVVGYIKFREFKTIYTWNEYTLFNPVYGYAFLSEYNGHWSFVQQTYYFPFENKSNFVIQGKSYSVYNDYKSAIDYAEGEFNWDILEVEYKRNIEFLSPPNMLIKEMSPSSLIWFKAEHIDPNEINNALNIKKSALPVQKGVGAMSPPVLAEKLNSVIMITAIFITLLIISQILFSMFAQDKEVFSNRYSLDSMNTIVTPSFKLGSSYTGTDNLEFTLSADVDNSWFETAITLVNDETGEEFYFEQGVEYYHGYEGGENWSEGSTVNSEILSQIPDGTYHMNITPYMDNSVYNKINNFNIVIHRGVSTWANFFWYFFGILIYPALLYFRNDSYEYQRWL